MEYDISSKRSTGRSERRRVDQRESIDRGGEPEPVVEIMKRMRGSDNKSDCREGQQGSERGGLSVYQRIFIDT